MNVAAVPWLLAALTRDCIGAHAGNMTPFRSLPLKCSRCVILVFTEIALLTRIGIDAPGLRGRADPATPTARPAAAPSTETAAPGDILIFPAPVNG
jgi:hypothetical protein